MSRHCAAALVTILAVATALGADPSCSAPAASAAGVVSDHGLTERFMGVASQLYLPAFGTEQLAPLLHSIVRFRRPTQVVELGFGYTTPFLARALADNALSAASERGDPAHPSRQSGVLHQKWYDEHPSAERPGLTVIDDQSQRGGGADPYAGKVEAVLEELGLRDLVSLEASMGHSKAHALFKPDSLGLVWNDAQWDPEFLRLWWPLLRRDGGLLLLHNVIGNGERSRWCVASPR